MATKIKYVTLPVIKLDEMLEDAYEHGYQQARYDYETQPCGDDAISRQAMLAGLASIAKAKARSDAQKALMGRVMFFTEQLPPVTPKQRTKGNNNGD